MTIREQVKKAIQEYDRDVIQSWLVREHTSCYNQWVVVHPDGTITEAEEGYEEDNEILYCISTEDGCSCDTCRMYGNYDWMTEEEFIEEWDEEDYAFCSGTPKDTAIRRRLKASDEDDVISEMLEALDEISFDYFDDERDEDEYDDEE